MVNQNIAWVYKFISQEMATFSAKIVHHFFVNPSRKRRHPSLNMIWYCIQGNPGIAQIFEFITELFTAL